eukprot:scaffold114961_cov51-Cyclotella_meneghiniana.AAC.1
MAVSLQIATQTIPNPTNTITNVYATATGGVGGIYSAAIAVKITAKWVFTSGRKDITHTKTQDNTTINWDAGRLL